MKIKRGKAIVFAGMGFELVGLIVVSLYIGQALDKTFELKGLATASLSLLVLAGWLIQLVYMLKSYLREEQTKGK